MDSNILVHASQPTENGLRATIYIFGDKVYKLASLKIVFITQI